MVTRFPLISSFVFAVVLFGAIPAQAQTPSRGELGVTAGLVDFDLSGTGQTTGVAVRMTRYFTPHLGLEVRTLFARPCQQFQSCDDVGPATLIVPEAQVQYRWQAGRVEPFVGAGLGASALTSSFDTRWDPTIAFTAGMGVRLTNAVSLVGEFRLRGHEFDFTGSTAEFNGGVAWRLPF